MGKDKLKTTALCVIALKTHPNRFRSGNRLTVSVWKQDQEFTFLIHDCVLSLEISVIEHVMLVSQKPGIPEIKPEPESTGPGRVGFHLIKFQVSRAMLKRNPKIRVGSGFGILQVFAHSRLDC